MENKSKSENPEEIIDIGRYFQILRPCWWKIISMSFAVGLVTLGYMFTKPNQYSASATITPATEEGKQSPALGVLATFGFMVGGPSNEEDLESLFRSHDLSVRVFRKYNLWETVFPERFDSKTGLLRSTWIDKLYGKGEYESPSDWDAIRAAEDSLQVTRDRKLGTVYISFESRFPEGAEKIVQYYLEEAKTRLQEEALDRANKNMKFIEEQISRTVDALTRDRLYSLYGQEIENEMMARNREQFAFRIIDSPRVPDRKSGPHRAIISLLATTFSFMVFLVVFLVMKLKNN